MKETAIEILAEKIDREYEQMRENWWDMTADELIENAEKIAVSKFIRGNIRSCVNADTAEYLAKFRSPLNALVESIICSSDPQGIALQERLRAQIDDLYDKQDLEEDYETEGSEEIAMQ